MLITIYARQTTETVNSIPVYKAELRAKNQQATVFGKRSGVIKFDIDNSFNSVEVLQDISKSNFYDNELGIRIYDSGFNAYFDLNMHTSYFITHVLNFCEGNVIKTELAYVPNKGIMLKSSTEYSAWENQYLKEYSELGTKKKGTGLYNGKRNANCQQTMYYASGYVIQYIGKFKVPADILYSRNNSRSAPAVQLAAGSYHFYVERSVTGAWTSMRASSTSRKLHSVNDLIENKDKSIKNISPDRLLPFFYETLVFGWPRMAHRHHNDQTNECIPDICSSGYRRIPYNKVTFDFLKRTIVAK